MQCTPKRHGRFERTGARETCAKGLLQPALKCRGREYLRIIYGPTYDLHQPVERLRSRGLSGKRSLAIRRGLGIESRCGGCMNVYSEDSH